MKEDGGERWRLTLKRTDPAPMFLRRQGRTTVEKKWTPSFKSFEDMSAHIAAVHLGFIPERVGAKATSYEYQKRINRQWCTQKRVKL
jgi:hypothetical protein